MHPTPGRRHPSSVAGRALRILVFATGSIALALTAHRLGGASPPSSCTTAAATLALIALGWLLSRRERSGAQIAALVVGTQLVLHLSFVAPEVWEAVRVRGAGGMSSASLAALLFCHHGRHPISAEQLRAASQNVNLHEFSTTPDAGSVTAPLVQLGIMLAAHLLAAGAMAWWLRRGERAMWAATGRVVRVLSCPVWRPAPTASRFAISATPNALVSRRWAGALAGRGPPVAALRLLLTPQSG